MEGNLIFFQEIPPVDAAPDIHDEPERLRLIHGTQHPVVVTDVPRQMIIDFPYGSVRLSDETVKIRFHEIHLVNFRRFV